MKLVAKILCVCMLLIGFNSLKAAYLPATTTFDASTSKVVFCYPNPATTFISFDFSKLADKNASLVIYNFVGKKIEEVKITANKHTINLDNYYRGLYLYQLKDKQNKITDSGKFQVIK